MHSSLAKVSKNRENQSSLVFDSCDDAHNFPNSVPKLTRKFNLNVLLQSGLAELGSKIIHVDIGAGKGRTLDEIADELSDREVISYGTEAFLYKNSDYKEEDPRIVSPQKINHILAPASASIVTVIAPDPMSPNFASQILSGINQMQSKGILFIRHEDFHQKGRDLLLSLGFKVAQLDSKFAQTYLTSNYPFPSVLYVAFKENKGIEAFLKESGPTVLSLKAGIERLKLFGRALNLCGAHRRQFSIEEIGRETGTKPKQIRSAIKEWGNQFDKLYLRRFEIKGSKVEV